MIAAFVAGALALIVAAWLAITSGRAYVAAEGRLEALGHAARVLSELSSTAETERGAARELLTKRVADVALRMGAEREAARRELESVEQASALLGALTIAFFGAAYAALLRSLRRERRLHERMLVDSNHDPLTGLPNRHFFGEWLTYAITHARRDGGHVGVLFIDISGCTAVAELHGGRAADALQVEIARRFRTASREGDLFARLSPTQFALATPDACDGRQLALLAQRLRDQLNDAAQPPLADTPIGASIGIAFFPEDADDSAGVMAAANAAMYAARRAGRNHVAFNALAA